mgnify:FL=1
MNRQKELEGNVEFILGLNKRYKEEFKKALKRGQIPNQKKICEIIWFENQLGEYKIDSSLFFDSLNWHHNLLDGNFLCSLLYRKGLREIIFHDHDLIQIDDENGTHIEKVSFINKNDFQIFIDLLAVKNSIKWNSEIPFASFNATIQSTNLRATLIYPETSGSGVAKLFLRAISSSVFPLSSFTDCPETRRTLIDAVEKKKNILICGSTGSGKTSFLSSLLDYTKENEHTVIMEDIEEIVPPYKSSTTLLSKQTGSAYSLKSYCSYALRMRPDRICVGEMRSVEVIPFLLSMNTGNRGLMSTIHASSARDAIQRLSLLFSLYSEGQDIKRELIIEMAAKNLDLIVFLENRKIKEISAPLGAENGHIFFDKLFV